MSTMCMISYYIHRVQVRFRQLTDVLVSVVEHCHMYITFPATLLIYAHTDIPSSRLTLHVCHKVG